MKTGATILFLFVAGFLAFSFFPFSGDTNKHGHWSLDTPVRKYRKQPKQESWWKKKQELIKNSDTPKTYFFYNYKRQ